MRDQVSIQRVNNVNGNARTYIKRRSVDSSRQLLFRHFSSVSRLINGDLRKSACTTRDITPCNDK